MNSITTSIIDDSRYNFVERAVPEDGTSVHGIRLNDEEYLGFIFAFTGDISVGDEENTDGTTNIEFNYDVLDMGCMTEENLNETEFKALLGNILVDIISSQLDTAPDTIVIKGT
jgi:hypothetical protein